MTLIYHCKYIVTNGRVRWLINTWVFRLDTGFIVHLRLTKLVITIFIMGLCILLRVLSRFVSKTVPRNKYSRCFYLYSLSRHVSAYLMAILKRIVQNIKRSCYFYINKNILNTRCGGRFYQQTSWLQFAQWRYRQFTHSLQSVCSSLYTHWVLLVYCPSRSRVPASHGGHTLSWVPELSPSHSHSNSWLIMHWTGTLSIKYFTGPLSSKCFTGTLLELFGHWRSVQ
jgi:hypothetical protein